MSKEDKNIPAEEHGISKLSLGKIAKPEEPKEEITIALKRKEEQVDTVVKKPISADDTEYKQKLEKIHKYLQEYVGKVGYNPFLWMNQVDFLNLYNRFVDNKGKITEGHRKAVRDLEETPDVSVELAPDLTKLRGKRNRITS